MIEIILTTFVISAAIFLALKSLKLIFAWSMIAQAIISILSTIFVIQYMNHNVFTIFGSLDMNNLAVLMFAVVIFVTNITLLYSYTFLNHQYKNESISLQKVRLFFILAYLFIPSMLMVLYSGNLALSWLGVELSILTSVFLVGFYNKKTSFEAAWKYFIINTIGSTIALFGILSIVIAGTSVIDSGSALSFGDLMKHALSFHPTLIKIAFVFVMIGLGTTIGLVPMHTWFPDANGKAVSPISGLISTVLPTTALFLLLRIREVVDTTLGNNNFTSSIMLIFGVLTITYAALLIITQRDYKRLLAYSSVQHMGILTILFALSTPLAVFFACYHYVFHTLIKSSLFLTSGNIFMTFHTTRINKVRGLIKRTPFTGFIFLALIIAIIGLPPFGLFTTELGLFNELIKLSSNAGAITVLGLNINGILGTTILVLTFSGLVLGAIGLINSVVKLSLDTQRYPHEQVNRPDNRWGNLTILLSIVVLLLISINVIPFVNDLIVNFSHVTF